MNKYIRIAVLVFATCVMTGAGYAAVTLTDIGTAAPTPGPYDISQFSTNGNGATKYPGGLNYYTDNNPPPGQTFTTTSTSTNLVSVAIRTGGFDSGGGYGTPGTTPKYYLRIYSVSGNTATLITNYVAANPGFTDGDWLKWNNLNVALVAEPANADLENWLGYAYRHEGKYDAAFEHYRAALQLDPKHRGAHEYIGETYLLTGNKVKAREHLAALARICGSKCESERVCGSSETGALEP